MKFTKVQSLGNDFVLVALDEVASDTLPELARKTADRHFGIGSDGLLAVGHDGRRLILRMFNTDGSEDFCGNGLRCAALYGYMTGWTGPQADICHFGQCVRTEVSEGGLVRSEMEPATFEPSHVPINLDRELFLAPLKIGDAELSVSAVSTGSTHTVIFCDELPKDELFRRLGPLIENHPLFPQRTSAIWAKDEDSNTIAIRIWERGVGETQGCGTGSAAVAAVYLRALEQLGSVIVNKTSFEASAQLPQDIGNRAQHTSETQGTRHKTQDIRNPSQLNPLTTLQPNNLPPHIYVKNPGGAVQVSLKSYQAPIISSAVAEIMYTATFNVLGR